MFLVYKQDHNIIEENKKEGFPCVCLSGYNTRIRRSSVASEPVSNVKDNYTSFQSAVLGFQL